MTTPAKKNGSVPSRGHTVVYRGIKMVPMTGRRSATAERIRQGLRSEPRQARAKAAHP